MCEHLREGELVKGLQRQIAQLEFINDQLQAELEEANATFSLLGFSSGLRSACAAAQELHRQLEESA